MFFHYQKPNEITMKVHHIVHTDKALNNDTIFFISFTGQHASQPSNHASQLAAKFGNSTSSSGKYSSSTPGGAGGTIPGAPAAVEKKKRTDRSSDEYRRRRERNNVAVRKSREKAKIRTKDTEDRVKILARENERLQKKVELLQEELAVLRSLFSNVGVLPDHIHRELSKQQQHNALAYM